MELVPIRVHAAAGSRATFTCSYRGHERLAIEFQVLGLGNRTGEEVARTGEEVARMGEEVARTGEEVAWTGEEEARTGEEVARTGEEVARVGEGVARVRREGQYSWHATRQCSGALLCLARPWWSAA